MKHNILVLIIFGITVACNPSKKNETDYSNIDFSLDTVMIDSKGEFLFLQLNLRWSDVSSDGKYLYNFNVNQHALEIINLDNLELDKLVQFEKEGPNGTGSRVGQIHSIGRDSLYFSSDFDHEIFDLNGKKLLSQSTKNINFSDGGFKDSEHLPKPVMWSKLTNQIFGFGRNWMDPETSFIKIDFSEKVFQRVELPAFDVMKDFHYTMEHPKVWFGPEYFTSIVGENVILSIGVAQPIYIYTIPSGKLNLYNYTPGLTAGEKSIKPPKQIAAREENRQVEQMLKEQINFLHPIWDEKNKRFFRFSYEEVFPENMDESNTEKKAKVYLTVLDENLSILSEQFIPDLNFIPYKAFVKDANIWIPINIEDELGFVRIKVAG